MYLTQQLYSVSICTEKVLHHTLRLFYDKAPNDDVENSKERNADGTSSGLCEVLNPTILRKIFLKAYFV
jgi:hypothetical protein